MNNNSYRDMHLLDELTKRPETTQRELSKQIGVALGLTNLMLRRLVKKGYVKISGTKPNRIRYLITPTGILEKSRLTYEFIQHSIQLYTRVRQFLRQQLASVAQCGHRRVILYGTGELAELAFLTIHEMGFQLVGVTSIAPSCEQFLGQPVRQLAELEGVAYDRMIVCSLHPSDGGLHGLVALGVPADRLIVLPIPGMPPVSLGDAPREMRAELFEALPQVH